jgi:O-antigen ligase/polysaccharide polymerase Wzy-like membrane protein
VSETAFRHAPPIAWSRIGSLAARAEHAVLPVGAAVAVGGLLAANGGFFSVSWSWATLALLWVCALALLLGSPARPNRLERTFLGALVCFVAWVWISIAWSSDLGQSVFEGQRSLVLVAAVGAGLAVAHRRAVRPLLGGTLAGITAICLYALATRLYPGHVGHYDPLAVYRLNTPVGYWNGLGVVAAMGALLAFGFALRARMRVASALAGIALPILLLTLYFTYSRGSWVALTAGLVVLLALDPRRLSTAAGLALLAPAPALIVWLASRSHALTRQSSILAAAKHDGHRIALILLVVALCEAAIALAFHKARKLVLARAIQVAWGASLVVCLLAGVGAALDRYGSPVAIARHGYHDFVAPPPTNVVNLNARVFNLSNNGRVDLWKVAWHQADSHLLLGDGAGSYERYFLLHRTTDFGVEDAHSLYLETLSELGAVGLALLVLVLAVPLFAAVRFRRHRLVPFACAAYVAYLVHAAVDWDWELAGVTLAAVLCGLACVLAGRHPGAPVLDPWRRGIAATLAIGLSALTIVGLLGNTALESSQATASNGNWPAAERHARSAIRWMPWSPAGWQALGEAQLALHDRAGARRSLHRAIAKDPNDWVAWLDLISATNGEAQVAAVDHVYRLDPLDPSLVPYIAAVAGR